MDTRVIETQALVDEALLRLQSAKRAIAAARLSLAQAAMELSMVQGFEFHADGMACMVAALDIVDEDTDRGISGRVMIRLVPTPCMGGAAERVAR